jgi:hypothetical protein
MTRRAHPSSTVFKAVPAHGGFIMGIAGRIVLVLIIAAAGAVAGGLAGLAGGLVYTGLAGTPGFEGYSGFVVAYWMLAGIVLGFGAGAVVAIRQSRPPR